MCQILKLLTIFFLKKINKDINVKDPKKKEGAHAIDTTCVSNGMANYVWTNQNGVASARWTVVGPCKVMGYNQCN